jgi:hypothetical protein
LAEASYWTKQGLWPTAGNFLAIEDVFSTWVYTGTSAANTITNGIDLAGKGGLVWTKSRSGAFDNCLVDTLRGVGQTLYSNSSVGNQNYGSGGVTSFSSTGYGLTSLTEWNNSSYTYASWTFREAPNFFDIVTYTGTGANQNIAHNLGSVPGMMLVKRTDTAANWQVYHRSNANTQYQVLNSTAAVATGATRWNSTTPTATEFTVGTDTTVNASGGTYVAYLFAHDTSSTGLIQCGSYTGNGTANSLIATLGFEPQWFLVKRTDTTSDWIVVDVMRGAVAGGQVQNIYANGTSAEVQVGSVAPGATGIMSGNTAAWGESNASGGNYIYMAIRRGPMKTPTLGTSVFAPVVLSSSAVPGDAITTNFPVDMEILSLRNVAGESKPLQSRLTGQSNSSTSSNAVLYTDRTDAETNVSPARTYGWDSNVGLKMGGWPQYYNQVYWNFRRAPGFFDVVCYTGTGNPLTLNHNLGVAPELILYKSRSSAEYWLAQSSALSSVTDSYLLPNYNSAAGSISGLWRTPTTTTFGIALSGNLTGANTAGVTYVSYLFASCPGVSKVGSYTGNGSSQTINCAFTTGARYVLIKRTDSTGNWFVWDSARGIVAGNDPYLALNSTAAEVTTDDSVDTDNTGFIVNQVAASNVNVNGGNYIFLAIA